MKKALLFALALVPSISAAQGWVNLSPWRKAGSNVIVSSSAVVIDGTGTLNVKSTTTLQGYTAITGTTIKLRNHDYVLPSTYTAGSTTILVNDGSGNLSYQNAITDPALLDDYNLFTASNVFVSTTVIPSQSSCSGYTLDGAVCWDYDDDTLYIGDGSAASAISGGGGSAEGWAKDNTTSIIYSTPTTHGVIVGSTATAVSGARFSVQSDATTSQFYVAGSSVVIPNIANFTMTDVSTAAYPNVYVDLSSSTLWIPVLSDCSSQTGLCAQTSDSTMRVSGTSYGGGGGSSEWTDGGTVIYPTEATDSVLIGTSTAISGVNHTIFGTVAQQSDINGIVRYSTFTTEAIDASATYTSQAYVDYVQTPVYLTTRRYVMMTGTGTVDDISDAAGFVLYGPSFAGGAGSMLIFSGTTTLSHYGADGKIYMYREIEAQGGMTATGISSFELTGATMKHQGQLIRVSTSATISSSQNNYVPGDYSVIVASVTSASTMTGMSGGIADRHITIRNVGTANMTISHESTSSSAANRFITQGGSAYTLQPDDKVELFYDGNVSRWRVTD